MSKLFYALLALASAQVLAGRHGRPGLNAPEPKPIPYEPEQKDPVEAADSHAKRLLLLSQERLRMAEEKRQRKGWIKSENA